MSKDIKQCVWVSMVDPLDASGNFIFYFPRNSSAHKTIKKHHNGMESEVSREQLQEILKDRIPEWEISEDQWDCVEELGELALV